MVSERLGITVMPEYFQSEGVAAVLDNIQSRAGATSVTTSPYVAAETAAGVGFREPPDDAGKGKLRLLDRPLWGKREVWMETAASFHPKADLYENLSYRPPAISSLTDDSGPVVGAFLDAAKARGIETFLQVQAAIPPGHRVQLGAPIDGDNPLLPNGQPGGLRVDRNASLASPSLRAYMRAFIGDLCQAYPQVDGLKFDWPEYPVYTFESLFFDFNPAVEPIATRAGADLAAVAEGVQVFLNELSDGGIRRRRISAESWHDFIASLFDAYPVLDEMIAIKTAVVEDYARFLRECLQSAGGPSKKLFLQCFPPPLNRATGFDLERVGAVADCVGIKFYTMHWPLIEADYLTALRAKTEISPDVLMRAISRVLNLSPDRPRTPEALRYPEPEEDHPAAHTDIADKIGKARKALPESTRLVGIAHGYGPTEDVQRRFKALTDTKVCEVSVNRYCYLTDEKLDALGAASGLR